MPCEGCEINILCEECIFVLDTGRVVRVMLCPTCYKLLTREYLIN
jgi:hypothetical protein